MFKHAISEGIKNLVRSFWLSATAITVLTISIFSVAFAITLSTVVGFTVRQLDKQVSIPVFFKEGVDQEVINKTQGEISNLPNVKEVKYISNEEAREELKRTSNIGNIEETLEDKDINIDLGYLNVFPQNAESYNNVYNVLVSESYQDVIDDVGGSQDLINNLERIYYWTNVIGLIVIVIFAVISILVMMNILRITVYNHRTEIEIMRLVGATNSYIRNPFVVEGTLFNIIASIIVIAIFVPAINFLLPNIRQFFQIDQSEVSTLVIQMYLALLATTLVSTLIGSVTTYFATQKYLKL
jgi:cell division transport system permease protein